MNTETKSAVDSTFTHLNLGIKVVRNLVAISNSTPDLLLKRSVTMKSLSKAINSLDKVISDKSKRAHLNIRKQSRILHNTLVSLNQGLATDSIDVDDFLTELRTHCAESVEALDLLSVTAATRDNIQDGVDLDGTLLGDMSSQSAKEIELGDLPDTLKMPVQQSQYTKTVSSLNRYDKAKQLLAKSINKSAVVPVALPLAVMFESGKLRNDKVLESIFPGKVDLIGVNGSRSQDIGLVLRDQVVLQFSKSAALENAHESVAETGSSSKLQTAKAVVKNLKAKIKPVIASYNEAVQELDDHLESKPTGSTKLALVRSKKQHAAKLKELELTVDDLKNKSAQVREKLAHYESRVREAQSVFNAHKKTKLVSENVFFDHVTEFLDSLRDHGRNYTLISSTFIQSPVNSDIMTCWVVESKAYHKMVGLAGNPKVFSWGPAWSTLKQQRKRAMPASMKLSTKIR